MPERPDFPPEREPGYGRHRPPTIVYVTVPLVTVLWLAREAARKTKRWLARRFAAKKGG